MKNKGIAAIIFCNDNAQFVVIGGSDDDVREKLHELLKADKNKHIKKWRDMDAATYERRFVWHTKHTDYETIK